jgi:flavin prenyltransferase
MTTKRLVIAVTGASGAPYAADLLQTLHALTTRPELHLVVSAGAKRVLATEMPQQPNTLEALADVVYDERDVGAAIASGSFRTIGMVIVPCSSSTLAKIAHGLGDTLITRAAHVMLKERKTLVLVPREAPYSRPMLEAMLKAHDAGARIIPASPGFYHDPHNISDLLGFISARILDQFDIEHNRMKRWKE